ncbi:MAG: hypothetical protein R3324_18725, partial [Halobacteriales archaeon]|nr:hypothetical protein [Halobacteriales archaeon]
MTQMGRHAGALVGARLGFEQATNFVTFFRRSTGTTSGRVRDPARTLTARRRAGGRHQVLASGNHLLI